MTEPGKLPSPFHGRLSVFSWPSDTQGRVSPVLQLYKALWGAVCCGPNSPHIDASDTPATACSSYLTPSCSQFLSINFSARSPLPSPLGWTANTSSQQAPLGWPWTAPLSTTQGDSLPQVPPRRGGVIVVSFSPQNRKASMVRACVCACEAEVWKLQEIRHLGGRAGLRGLGHMTGFLRRR